MPYQTDKRNKHITYLLIPTGTVPALKMSSGESFQQNTNVLQNNIFLIANAQLSEIIFSDWHTVKYVCSQVKMCNPDPTNNANNYSSS